MKSLTVILFTVLLAGRAPLAAAEEGQHHGEMDKIHHAMKACLEEIGVKPPEKHGDHLNLSEAQKEKIHACMEKKGLKPPGHEQGEDREKIHAAAKGCFEEIGVKEPKPGEHPNLNEEQRKKMHACMEKKGIQPPRHQR